MLTGRVRQSLILIAAAAATLGSLSAVAMARSGLSTHARRAAAHQPPRFAVAARRGMLELLGTGDHSRVSWDYKTGLWGGHVPANWWQSALAVTTMVRYAERVRSTAPVYHRVLMRTYKRNLFKPHAAARRYFANQFMDDTAWWGLAWLAASQYELYYRGDRRDAARFLAVAEWDARYIARQPRPCGGIEWSIGTPPDAITNAQFVALTAQLDRYRRSSGPFYNPGKAAAWLNDAQSALAWLENSGMVNVQFGSVLDSLNAACHVIGGSLTYTEGEVAEALTQMGRALADPSYYKQAAAFLRYTISPASGLTSGGILQEHCEARVGACSQVKFRLDLPAYKGLFVNAVSDWAAASGDHSLDGFLRAQAAAVVQNAIRGSHNDIAHCASPHTCQFAFHWTGAWDPAPLGITLGGQESALDALTAVLPRR